MELYNYPIIQKIVSIESQGAVPDNPFIPSFGVSPIYLAGREQEIESIKRTSLDYARMNHSRSSLIIGQRGIGKTVLLNHIEDLAQDSGWLTVKTTATSGFLDRMVSEQLHPILSQLKPSGKTKLAAQFGVMVPPVSAEIALETAGASEKATSLRDHIYAICKAVPERGIIFTIDEVNARARKDLEEFATVYQHAIRDELHVGVVLCAIPAILSPLLTRNAGPLTFLNRSNKIELGILDYESTQTAFRETLLARGTRTATEEVIRMMAALSKGYPFLIQAIGNLAWDVAPNSRTITIAHVKDIWSQARLEMERSVLTPIANSLSGRLLETAIVIAKNPGIHTFKLAKVSGVSVTSIGGISQRLIASGVASRESRGVLRLAIPYLAEYLVSIDGSNPNESSPLAIMDTFPEVTI